MRPHCHGYLVQGRHRRLPHITTPCTQTRSIGLRLRISEAPRVSQHAGDRAGRLPPPARSSCRCGWFLTFWVCTCKQSPVKTSAPQFSMGSSGVALFFALQARGAFQRDPEVGLLSALLTEVRDCAICSREAALPPLPAQMQTGAVGGQPVSNGAHQSEGKRQNPQISK